MRNLASVLLLMAIAVNGFAQPFNDPNFKKKFNKADALVYDEAFLEALPLLEDLYKYDTLNANLNHLLGICYLRGKKDHAKAIRLLESASRDVAAPDMYQEANWKERKAPGITYYYLGKAYHYKNRFDRAVTNYYNYRSFISLDDVATYNQVRQQIQYAENAMELIKNPVGVKITNLGPEINTQYSEYCPVVSADGKVLIFTSRRAGSTGNTVDEDGRIFDDIYICNKQPNGKWSKPRGIGSNINTPRDEAAIGLSPDGQLLFVYRDDNNDGNIYQSRKTADGWGDLEPLGSDINTDSWETHASVTATQDMLVFSSNRSQGGHGGRDLWYCKKLPTGEWGLAMNMGSVINTNYEEDSPFISADGKTLIFSSEGHTSMGGFDIFKSEFVDGAWTVPENIGYPINSAEHDVFFVLNPDGKTAFYSSRKDGGFGDTDLYKLRLETRQADQLAVARGIMKVPAMAYADIDAKILVTDEGGASVGTFRPNPATGFYVLVLDPGETYTVSYEADGYDPIVSQLPVDDSESYIEYDGVLELDEVVFGENILALQEQTKKLEQEKAEAAARAAEQEALAAEAAEKAKEEEEALALKRQQEEERRKAEELAAKEKEEAQAALAAEEAKARKAELDRKKAEAQARFKAKQEAAKKAAEAEAAAEEARLKEEAELAEQKAAEEEEAIQAAEAEALAQKEAEEEQQRLAEEKAKAQAELAEKQARIEEAKKAAEAQKLEQQALAEKAAEEEKARKDAELAAEAEAERAAQEEQERKAEEARKQQEAELAAKQAKIEAAKKAAEEAALAAEKEAAEKKAADDQAAEQQLADAKALSDAQAQREAAARQKQQELQERIKALKAQRQQQEKEIAEVKEVQVQKMDEVQKETTVNTAAIEAKRQTMLARINELKKRKSEVEKKKVVDEAAVVEATEKEKQALTKKEELVKKSEKTQEEIDELQKELEEVEQQVAKADEAVKKAQTEVAEAEEVLAADIAEEKRIAEEEQKKKEEAEAAARQIEELKEQERARIEQERLAAEQFEKEQKEEAERTKRELIQLEALAEQQAQVEAALAAEERKKQLIESAEKDAFSQEEVLANATTLEQLRKLNEQLIKDNLELKKQLAELNAKLDLILQRLDYQPDLEKVDMPASSTMKNLQEGRRLILRNIFFDYNQATLRSRSKHELNKLYDFMKSNPTVSIEVSGHTDSRGNDEYNMRLSKDRAQAVVNYLVRNGISSSRLKAIGYGETRPIARNENSDLTDNPVGRQLNRRIEISLPKDAVDGVEVEEIDVPAGARIK